MGVPAFFRWLSRKFPSIVVNCIEQKPKTVDGVNIPVDSSQENPNGLEFDNLYLDMNGIIHPCCHPENKPAPKNEDEMMVLIFEYIDRLFSIVRPRRLLYMAIDGVAPRAKMNQQRSRRFRASKESVEKVEEMEKIRTKLSEMGAVLPPEKSKEEHFDSNCITPGTPFMDRLAKCLHYYIHDRLNNDPGWKNIKVILSDANVPGEGEHKIMDYIRRQRSNPDHDPNTHHCLCGADADLIMLGLATHEPNFTIIREEFKPNQPRPCELCGQLGHEMKDCVGLEKQKTGEFDELEKPIETETQFIFLRLNILREYLERELTMENLPFPFSLERVVDDWVFMCFFVGNDFLPHLPSLEIREGAIDRLVNLYKKTVYRTGGYLTDSGTVNLTRVQLIMTDLGEVEDEIFKRRQQNEIAFKMRQKDRKKKQKLMNDRPAWTPRGQFAPTAIGNRTSPVQNARQEAYQMRTQGASYGTSASHQGASNHSAADQLKSMLREGSGTSSNESNSKSLKRKAEDSSDEDELPDDVRLWEDGFKDRYYEVKFEVSVNNIEFRQKVAAAYVEGLCWVLRYYYQGCASWKWFFPYHYAPFASDFINIGDLDINFEKGTQPFKPLEQLMGVFPAASKSHLPKPWGKLMDDPESSIIDFYPTDFKIDLNGKKFAWQGVALLPFVDEKRLLTALKPVYPLLAPEEIRRNVRGDDRLYIRAGHSGYSFLRGLYENGSDSNKEISLNSALFNGVQGMVLLAEDVVGPNETLKCPIAGLHDVPSNSAICIRFRDPKYPDDFIFPAKRLPKAIDPPKVLKPGDLDEQQNRNWRPQIGMTKSYQRASLDMSGHRTLQRSMNSGSGYGQVPPPNNYRQPGNHYRNTTYPPKSYRGTPPVSTFHSNNQGWQNASNWRQYSDDRNQRPSRDQRGYEGNNRRDNSSGSLTGLWAPVGTSLQPSQQSSGGSWGPVQSNAPRSRDWNDQYFSSQNNRRSGQDNRYSDQSSRQQGYSSSHNRPNYF